MHLSSLHISGYRGINELKIPRLEQVNLLVGKNGVGKSSLLEALFLFANEGNPRAIVDFLVKRGESRDFVPRRFNHLSDSALDEVIESVRSLFLNRPSLEEVDKRPYSIKVTDSQNRLEIRLGPVGALPQALPMNLGNANLPSPQLEIKFSGKDPQVLQVEMLFSTDYRWRKLTQNVVFLPVFGLTAEKGVRYWNAVTLTPLQKKIISALNIIEPEITDLNFITPPNYSGQEYRVPYIVKDGEKIPLDSLGSGASRILGLALALANAENGLLLVDEIGTGLHFSVQTKMWEFLMTLAHELNVQIVATTHNSDCVQAFQHISNELENVEGQLIRLEKWGEKMTAILMDEERMEFALDKQIEVR